MSQTITDTRTPAGNAPANPLVRSIRWGLVALAVAVVAAIYGAYGDPHPKASQEDAVPFICAVAAVIAIGLFGFLVPAGLRGLARGRSSWSGWALALGIVAVLVVPVTFWSGLPVVLGTAAAVLGSAGRRHAGAGRALPTVALVVGVLAVVASLALLILGNTLAS